MDYTVKAATADRLIRKFGIAITLRTHLADLSPNPTPWKPVPGTDLDRPAQGVFLPRGQNRSKTYKDGSLVRQGDQLVYVSAVGLTDEPDLGDEVLRGTEVWIVKGVDALNPADTIVFYELEVTQ